MILHMKKNIGKYMNIYMLQFFFINLFLYDIGFTRIYMGESGWNLVLWISETGMYGTLNIYL
jgi:hypothetical protein